MPGSPIRTAGSIVCLVNVEPDRATFTWSEGGASFEPYTLDRIVYHEFKDFAENARSKLAALVNDYMYAKADMGQAAYQLAQAGYELYEALFDPSAAQQVRGWLEKLRDEDLIATLEIVVESPWSLPWTVIYDKEPAESQFLDNDESSTGWEHFWGLRYNLCSGRKVDPLRRMPIFHVPRVLMVVDPLIREGLPAEQQQRLATFIDEHQLPLVTTVAQLKTAIEQRRPDVLYWLSHAEPEGLILSGEAVTPRELRRHLKQDQGELSCGGLAFLNGCRTAEESPNGSFFEALHSVGFAGMIGTEHQTIDTIANPLGLDFLEEFLDGGQPAGELLRSLRRENVPLGLVYGTYCPPHIHVEKDKPKDSVRIIQLPHVEGTSLGPVVAPKPGGRPLPSSPYRSLGSYRREDRALFVGRDADTERFATMLDDTDTRILVLHGESGVGKSSFLRAGVIPFLEDECLGYRFLRQSSDVAGERKESVMFLRATNDLFGQLAHALYEFCSHPYEYQTPLKETVRVDLPAVLKEFIGDNPNQARLRHALTSDQATLGRIMSAISNQLPYAAVLVIDQAEELITLANTPEDLERGRDVLEMFRQTLDASGDFKLIVSLRTEYFGRFVDRIRRGRRDARLREYLLTDFDQPSLVEAILRPTSNEELPFTSEIPSEKYAFSYADGVAQEIARGVIGHSLRRSDSVLPLAQVICSQLYELACQRDDRRITSEDLHVLGGIEGGMRKHVEILLDDVLDGKAREKRPLQRLFTKLYLKQPDGSLTTALLPKGEVERLWTGTMPFERLVKALEDMRLLNVNSLSIGAGREQRYVSLGHDALAQIASNWDQELGVCARVRRWAIAASTVLVVAILMAGLAVSAWIFERDAVRARKRAETATVESVKARREAETARQDAETNFKAARGAVHDYYREISQHVLLNTPGMQPLRNELLEHAANYYKDFLKQRSHDRSVRSDVVTAHNHLGEIQRELGQLTEARHSYNEALNQLSKLEEQNDDTVIESWGNTLNALGNVHKLEANTKQAVDAYENALTYRKKLADRHASVPKYRRRFANTLMNLGNVRFDSDDATEKSEAVQLMQQAQAIRNELLNSSDVSNMPAPTRQKIILDLGKGYQSLALARLYGTPDDASDAEFVSATSAATGFAKQAIDQFTELVDPSRAMAPSLEHRFQFARSYKILGDCLYTQGDPACIDKFRIAVDELAKLSQQSSQVPKFKEELKRAKAQLGGAQKEFSGVPDESHVPEPSSRTTS